MNQQSDNLGIVVSGGPAPGINSAIHATVIEARKAGMTTFGLYQGFKSICFGSEQAVQELTIEQVSRIHHTGGSILGTSRVNPLANAESFDNLRAGLARHSIRRLVVIGGDGSASVSFKLSQVMPDLQIVHVPKTIDNDLKLPNHHPSFGFETARHAGTKIVNTLMVDAATCDRWYVITTMGRKAGFLALGLGVASGATLTLIPEEFEGCGASISGLADLILSSVRRRQGLGKEHGIVLLAEGILDCIDPASCSKIAASPRDDLGRLHYTELELSELVVAELRSKAGGMPIRPTFIASNIGYELRCLSPISFDIEYTRMLGFGAVKFLMAGHSGIMVIRDHDSVGFLKLAEMIDSEGAIQSRKVDLNSDSYRVASSFMLR